jgi:hypothetical protein
MQPTAIARLNALRNRVRGIEVIVPKQCGAAQQRLPGFRNILRGEKRIERLEDFSFTPRAAAPLGAKHGQFARGDRFPELVPWFSRVRHVAKARDHFDRLQSFSFHWMFRLPADVLTSTVRLFSDNA